MRGLSTVNLVYVFSWVAVYVFMGLNLKWSPNSGSLFVMLASAQSSNWFLLFMHTITSEGPWNIPMLKYLLCPPEVSATTVPGLLSWLLKSLLCVTRLNAVDAVKGVWTSASSVCPKKVQEGLLATPNPQDGVEVRPPSPTLGFIPGYKLHIQKTNLPQFQQRICPFQLDSPYMEMLQSGFSLFLEYH